MSTTTHLMTADELIKLPRDKYRYELVKGELLTMSPSGAEHGAVTVNLTAPLATYVKAHKLGIVFGAKTGFKLELFGNRSGSCSGGHFAQRAKEQGGKEDSAVAIVWCQIGMANQA